MNEEQRRGALEVEIADQDVELARPSSMVKLAGSSLALAGLFQLVLAVQTWSIVRLLGVWALFPWLFLLLGLGGLLLGAQAARSRGWAVVSGTALASVGLLVSLTWLVFSVLNLLFSLVALGLPPLWLTATALSALSIKRALESDKARERLGLVGPGFGV